MVSAAAMHVEQAGLSLADPADVSSPINWAVQYWSTSREKFYEALAGAYAFYLLRDRHSQIGAVLIAKIQSSNGEIADGDWMRAALDLFIHHGEPTSPSERRRIDKAYSRDALAIRHLIRSGVAPDQVQSLVKTVGEGVDNWIRADKAPRADKVDDPRHSDTFGITFWRKRGSRKSTVYELRIEDGAGRSFQADVISREADRAKLAKAIRVNARPV